MNRQFLYGIYVILISLACCSCDPSGGKLPPLKETYSQQDKNPFGSYVLHNQLEQLYYHNTILTISEKFDNTWRNISDTGSLYIGISKYLFLSNPDLEGMLNYVNIGNSLFISSEHIDQHLLDTLGLSISKPNLLQSFAEMKYTSVELEREVFRDSAAYEYFYIPFNRHFTRIDSLTSKPLGSNQAGTNFLVVFYGRGRFYLHLEPRALSNYFLLQKENFRYLRNLFALTPTIPEHVYWDDYYRKLNYQSQGGGKSSLSVLLQYPAMAWAFWLLLVLLVLYIYFGGKRRQRIVEPIAPNINTTLTYTETIGRLYLQKKDNRNIADKLVTYFLEHIRNHYFLNTSHFNETFISTLSRKTNNTKEGTALLFQSIAAIQQSTELTDQELLQLNQQIENFYKNKI